jgi:hypothetical protein
LFDEDTTAPLNDLSIDHERIMHVFLISTDLTDMQHLHPVETAPGVYEVTFTPRVDSHYMAYATFKLGVLELQDIRHLAVHSGHVLEPSLSVDLAAKSVDGLQIKLIPPAEVRAKEPTLFRIRVEQSNTGAPIRDLQTLLGAGAQVVIAHENGHHIMHMYAQPGVPRRGGMLDMPAPTLPFGPNLGFTQVFDEPGFYRVWIQIEHKGQIVTAPFTIEVK